MKTVELSPREYYDFKKLAVIFKIWFEVTVVSGIVYITADVFKLMEIGY